MTSVLSLQVGRIAPLGPKKVPSGFVKLTISGSIRAGAFGLHGDEQADLKVHGGKDKAIYAYPSEHYPRWAHDVPAHGQTLLPGAFGENVTTIGLDEQAVSIGDTFSIGSAQLQITQPRQPCFKLGLRFADNTLGRIMMQSGRTGWYMRVLQEGEITAGDEIRILRRPHPHWTIARFNDFILGRSATVEELNEMLELEGLARVWRDEILQKLRDNAGN